jgi:hypothetical protein
MEISNIETRTHITSILDICETSAWPWVCLAYRAMMAIILVGRETVVNGVQYIEILNLLICVIVIQVYSHIIRAILAGVGMLISAMIWYDPAGYHTNVDNDTMIIVLLLQFPTLIMLVVVKVVTDNRPMTMHRRIVGV